MGVIWVLLDRLILAQPYFGIQDHIDQRLVGFETALANMYNNQVRKTLVHHHPTLEGSL